MSSATPIGPDSRGSGVRRAGYLDEIMASLTCVLQPIVRVATGEVFAYEGLARFGDQEPEAVIRLAESVGRGTELEAACAWAAARRRRDLPAGIPVSINISPRALHATYVAGAWAGRLDGCIVEITEHAARAPEELDHEVAMVRERGGLVAVDDVGTGYAGLLRLASMRPDLVKIDKSIVTGVRHSVVKSAVLESLVTYSHRIGAAVIAEGVESLEDLIALADFDVDFAQGWLIGHPLAELVPIAEEVVQACRRSREAILARGLTADGPAAETRSMYEATSSIALATEFAELRDAVDRAAVAIGVDDVAMSLLDRDGRLRELFAAGSDRDDRLFVVEQYPATDAAITTGQPTEVHLADRYGDVAEQTLMRELGMASLLIVPLGTLGRPIGILEFFQRVDRRWTTVDIEQARGLALHLGNAWARMAKAPRHDGTESARRPRPTPVRPSASLLDAQRAVPDGPGSTRRPRP